MSSYTFSSESVSEGHPDKVCDYIADSILDAHLAGDPNSRVACEVLCKSGQVVLAGEITSRTTVDYERVARQAIREIGYTDPSGGVQRRRREGHSVHQQAVGRHRDGRRHRRRRRSGHHVRLRERRDAGAHAAPHPARASSVASPRDGAQER